MQTPSRAIRLFPAWLLLLLSFLACSGSTAPALSTGSAHGGFRFRLIHRDSIYSPSYPGNLTAYEFLQRRVNYARALAQRMRSRAGRRRFVPDDLTPIVTHADGGGREYIVQVSIGSNNVSQYLQLDTGSDLLWVQCEPYQGSHFKQDPPHYVMGNSTTLSFVPCSDKTLCTGRNTCEPIRQRCLASVSYWDGSWVKGFLSKERFSFENDGGDETAFDNITFGCMSDNKERVFTSTKIAGILAMGRGNKSLAMQLASLDREPGMPQFTYCLVPWEVKTASLLKFGQDFSIGGTFQTLKFLESKKYPNYYLDLIGISCNDERLDIPEDVFRMDEPFGTLIDSGSTLSLFISPAYVALKAYLVEYFHGTNALRVQRPGGLDLCYALTGGLSKPLPYMVYHFRGGANMTVAPDNMWLHLVDGTASFCLGILPSDHSTLIGSNHQANMRFVYDMKEGTLSYRSEECAGDE